MQVSIVWQFHFTLEVAAFNIRNYQLFQITTKVIFFSERFFALKSDLLFHTQYMCNLCRHKKSWRHGRHTSETNSRKMRNHNAEDHKLRQPQCLQQANKPSFPTISDACMANLISWSERNQSRSKFRLGTQGHDSHVQTKLFFG